MRTPIPAVGLRGEQENYSHLEDQGCLPEGWCGGNDVCRLNNITYGCLIDSGRAQAVVWEFGEGGGIGSILV